MTAASPRSRRGTGRARRLAACVLALLLASVAGGCFAGEELQVAADVGDSEAGFSFAATRTGAGILMAGGEPAAFALDGAACKLARKIQISYIGLDAAAAEPYGFGRLVVDDPWRMVGAYLADLNAAGGIDGRCVQASVHTVDWRNAEAEHKKACRSALSLDPAPVLAISLFGDARTVKCIAEEAQIPLLGLSSSVPATVQRSSRGKLFLDDGTTGHLLGNAIVAAHDALIVAGSDRLGLLYGPPVGTDATADDYNIGADFAEIAEIAENPSSIPASIAHVPARFGDLGLLALEDEVRLLESNLTSAALQAANAALAQISDPEIVQLLQEIEGFYLAEAEKMRDSEVQAVFAAAPWFELRRLMLAAERVEWYPRWIASDAQNPSLLLPGLPMSQVQNFFSVSSRPAVGDEPTALDRGCITTRQAAPGAEAFEFRPYSDAWILTVAVCDLLDVAMSALSRVPSPPTAAAVAEALIAAPDETGTESRLRFGPGDFSGATRFRVLRADFDCGLNAWGCMRPVRDWTPALSATGG